MKFCKDCKHYAFEFCQRSAVQHINLVSGGKTLDGVRICSEERASFFGCGKRGKYWEAKA